MINDGKCYFINEYKNDLKENLWKIAKTNDASIEKK